jgi:hypothetical protein
VELRASVRVSRCVVRLVRFPARVRVFPLKLMGSVREGFTSL